MKRTILFALFFLSSVLIIAQARSSNQNEIIEGEKTAAVSIGLLHGGGSLVGVDFEKLISPKVGIQAGIGIVGFGAGINYHFKPSIRSSFLSLQYWNQGIGDSFTQNVIGGNYVYRGKKWFTATIGLGIPLSEGPNFPSDVEQPAMFLTYAIGAYIPI